MTASIAGEDSRLGESVLGFLPHPGLTLIASHSVCLWRTWRALPLAEQRLMKAQTPSNQRSEDLIARRGRLEGRDRDSC